MSPYSPRNDEKLGNTTYITLSTILHGLTSITKVQTRILHYPRKSNSLFTVNHLYDLKNYSHKLYL